MFKLSKIRPIKTDKKLILVVSLTLILFFIYSGYYPKNVHNLYLCNFIIDSIKKQECRANIAKNLDVEKAIDVCSNLEDAFIKDVCFSNLIKSTGNLNETIQKTNQKICNMIIDPNMRDGCIIKIMRYHLPIMMDGKNGLG